MRIVSLPRLAAALLVSGSSLLAQELTILNWSTGLWAVSSWTRGGPGAAWEKAPFQRLHEGRPWTFQVDAPGEHVFSIEDGTGGGGCLLRVVREAGGVRLQVESEDELRKAVEHAIQPGPGLEVHISARRFHPGGAPPMPGAPALDTSQGMGATAGPSSRRLFPAERKDAPGADTPMETEGFVPPPPLERAPGPFSLPSAPADGSRSASSAGWT
jgi:hypothetical protein